MPPVSILIFTTEYHMFCFIYFIHMIRGLIIFCIFIKNKPKFLCLFYIYIHSHWFFFVLSIIFCFHFQSWLNLTTMKKIVLKFQTIVTNLIICLSLLFYSFPCLLGADTFWIFISSSKWLLYHYKVSCFSLVTLHVLVFFFFLIISTYPSI